MPILSMGIINDIINKINVNAAKNPRKYKKYLLNSIFEKRSKPITNANHEPIKRIRIINNSVFFDKFFKPEINLIINTHNYI